MTTDVNGTGPTLGINGLGRIGKLTIWQHALGQSFDSIVVNVGREVGTDLEAICASIEKDSTYGAMHRFLFGVNAEPCIKITDRDRGVLDVAGLPLTVLRQARDPRDIPWRDHGVRVVVDATGAFNDPTQEAEGPRGSLRGHLAGGADVVINSAAFKIKDKSLDLPDDASTMIFGINHESFDPLRHNVISAASCTTTALAHLIKPLLDGLHASSLMTASMSTVHATTNTQSLLDTLPEAGQRDLRRNRSALNSIILTSTNAAAALEQVIPEIRQVGFMADSVRVPIPTQSLIILNVTFQSHLDDEGRSNISRSVLNRLYADAADGAQKGLLICTDEQNVPADVSGMKAAVVVEAVETHTRTGFVSVDLSDVPGLGDVADHVVEVPVTHAKVFGWYDNEFGSYVNLLGDLTTYINGRLE